ncbi:MAG: efflux RND transporter periplasmic adaptor subunit, partial [Thermoguttaceae bacterium]|nr:efflux RND transporter periplasmic adaptor subunit [Thermoguttaceae bacterium]
VNGNRKEDIDLARAGVEVFDAQIHAAENLYERNKKLSSEEGVRAVSQQDLDNAESNFKKLVAERKLAQTNLEKMLAGSRKEDIAAAKAALEQAKAQKAAAEAAVVQAQAALTTQKQVLADCQLFSPRNGVVRSRVLEPGEMAAPQSPVLIIAVENPKWVRVYLNETLLTKVKPSDKALVRVDGMADKPFEGWVGYISPTAEFTPKNVETPELRTSLVYEVRVFVNDPEGKLKLGAPATVEIN